jgi:hypothetical protein
MTKPAKSPPWQEMRRALSAKSKTELLNLIRDLFALNPENQDIVRTQALTPKAPPRRQARGKDPQKHQAAQVASKIRRLAQIAADLRKGEHFEVTRLTTVKSLCEDAQAAAQFALHLAKVTSRKMQERDCPSHLDPEKWEYCQQVVAEAIRQMERYLNNPTEEEADMVRAWLSDVRAIQNTYRNQAWGPVRIIQSTDVLLVEYALSCLLQPHASADWGYRMAREYAERYDSRYSTGLIPESAPMVEDIADFWCQYHMGKPLQAWLGIS